MKKINTADGLFADGNPSTGAPGTILTAAWLNMMQAEVIAVLAAAGVAEDAAKSDQLATAIQILLRGKASINVAGGAGVNLTAAQYSVPILILTGALTANINVIFPAASGAWIVRNQTTGNFTVTCKTAAGSGVVLAQGCSNALFGDGTNIYPEQSDWSGLLAVAQQWTAAQRGAVSTLAYAATVAVDLALANNFALTLAGAATLNTPTNAVAGQSGIIAVTQDATGSRLLAFAANWKFASGVAPVLSTAAGAVDYLAYYVETPTRIYVSRVRDVK